MEVTSRFIEHADIGNLHVVRFEPESPRPDELGIMFNSHNGRVTTIDGFALPYQLALHKNIAVDFIERPMTGTSGEIIDPRLNKEYRKYGFVTVKEAVAEAHSTDSLFRNAKVLHLGGFSLGAYAASLYGEHVDGRVGSALFVDPAGTCKVNPVIGSARYGLYWGVEEIGNELKIKPKVDPLLRGFSADYKQFMQESKLQEPPARVDGALMMDLRQVTKPTDGKALRALDHLMRGAAEAEKPFELRASFSPMRIITDHESVAQTNEVLDTFDKDYPDQQTVQYGFLQGHGMSWWHDLALDPTMIRDLAQMPMSWLRKRLRYFG